MRRYGPAQALATIAGSVLLWAVVAALALLAGSRGSLGSLDLSQLPWRLESVLVASLVGAALASAGVAYQAVLRNPLADPYLLGASTGAALFAYLWQFAGATAVVMALGQGGRAMSQQAFAFVGAIAAVAAVFALSSRRGRLEPVTLLLVGVIVNAINASIFLLVNAISRNRPGTGGAEDFLVGRINPTLGIEQKWVATAVVGIGWLAMMYLGGRLNVASVGEDEAESLGVRIHWLRWLALGVASVVTAAAVAISGPIGFVGLVCPHLARLIVGMDVRRTLPVATALGAALLTVADALSRYLSGAGRASAYLPVGVLTGLLGGPFFLLLLWQSRRRLTPEGTR